ncbi:hypothetical protein RFI_13085 [Reticulomyxa filosa]|uniref:Uncharacterized protein n=1 Tax=Reticulomyxa filosa TaxID=46433 RepID=X6NCM9_RETFI|nr:hypothetical protein RFI_13085 [Reticulomyxa filosa]|eukprot:ETO24070.1 hypothetical protein RFI_13085 [Reticulomyxa filosa]
MECKHNIAKWSKELAAIKKTMEPSDTKSIDIEVQCIETLEALLACRKQRDDLEMQMETTFRMVYSNWSNVQSWRSRHGRYAVQLRDSTLYKGNPLQLLLDECALENKDDELKQREADLSQELIEWKELTQLRNTKQSRNQKQEPNVIAFDEKECRRQILSRQQKCLRPCGAAQYVPLLKGTELTSLETNEKSLEEKEREEEDLLSPSSKQTWWEDGIVPIDLCNSPEKLRRKQAAKQNVILAVYVDDQLITKCKHRPIPFPHCVSPLQCNIEINLVDFPQNITCRSVLFDKQQLLLRSGWWDSHVITVQLPIHEILHFKSVTQCVPFCGSNIDPNKHMSLSEFDEYIKPLRMPPFFLFYLCLSPFLGCLHNNCYSQQMDHGNAKSKVSCTCLCNLVEMRVLVKVN